MYPSRIGRIKGPIAVGIPAAKRPFTRVQSHMSTQVVLSRKELSAIGELAPKHKELNNKPNQPEYSKAKRYMFSESRIYKIIGFSYAKTSHQENGKTNKIRMNNHHLSVKRIQ